MVMKQRNWIDSGKGCQYFFNTSNGLIIGQVYNLAHTNIWGSKIPLSAIEDKILGHYINVEFAKLAVEAYWNVDDKTLLDF